MIQSVGLVLSIVSVIFYHYALVIIVIDWVLVCGTVEFFGIAIRELIGVSLEITGIIFLIVGAVKFITFYFVGAYRLDKVSYIKSLNYFFS